MKKYHWTYQCYRCFIKSGDGFSGSVSEAWDNAPSCCGGEPMSLIKGNETILSKLENQKERKT